LLLAMFMMGLFMKTVKTSHHQHQLRRWHLIQVKLFRFFHCNQTLSTASRGGQPLGCEHLAAVGAISFCYHMLESISATFLAPISIPGKAIPGCHIFGTYSNSRKNIFVMNKWMNNQTLMYWPKPDHSLSFWNIFIKLSGEDFTCLQPEYSKWYKWMLWTTPFESAYLFRRKKRCWGAYIYYFLGILPLLSVMLSFIYPSLWSLPHVFFFI
jgi:hypothetical protein